MALLDDKKAFAERLRQALKRSGKDASSATELAMQFNLRHPNEPITVQAAQKWLTGKARPTLDKVQTLAAWLNVSVEWLRFGVSNPSSIYTDTAPLESLQTQELSPQDISFLTKFKRLSVYQQHLIVDLVEQLSLERSFHRK